MANFFDQFDAPKSNFFDQFDAPPKQEKGFLSNVGTLLKEGAEQALASAEVSPSVIAGSDVAGKSGLIAKQLAKPQDAQPKELQEVKGAFKDEGEAWKNAQGFTESVGAIGQMLFEVGRQAITNPKGLAYMTAEQAANMAPSIAGMIGGGKLGAAGGTFVAPGVGTAVGAVTGAAAGAFAGGAPLEIGSEFISLVGKELAARELPPTESNVKALLQDREFTDRAIGDARVKGATTAGIDAALTTVSGGIATGPRRAALKAATQELGAGADAAQIAARAKDILGQRTIGQQIGTGAKAVGVDVAGGGLSEAGGQLAAYGEVDLADVGLEMLGELGGAGIEVPAAAYSVARGQISPQRQGVPPPAPGNAPQLELELRQAVTQLEQAVDPYVSVAQAQSTDDAIQAAGTASNVDLTPPDVMSMAQQRAMIDRQAELMKQADEAGFEFDRTQALEQARTSLPAAQPGPAEGFVDLTAMDERQATNRLRVLRDMTANEGGNALALAVVPHPTQEGRFAIGTRALPSLDISQPTPTVSPTTAQNRIESAALAGQEQGRKAEDAPRQAMISRAMASIEARGGVASPMEAELLRQANLGQPYNSIDPSLGRPASVDEQLTAATGLAVGQEAGVGFGARESTRITSPRAFEYSSGLQGQQRAEPAATPEVSLTEAFVNDMRRTNTPAARAFVQQYDSGRITDADVQFALDIQNTLPQPAQQRLETAAGQAPAPAEGIQVAQELRSRGVNPVLANAAQQYVNRPYTAQDLTVEGATARLERAAPIAQPAPGGIEVAGVREQRAEFPGRQEATVSNLPRPSRVGGVLASSLTDEQLRDTAGNDSFPAITRRGAQIELLARQQEQRGTSAPSEVESATARLESAATEGRLSQPSDGRVIITNAKLSTQRVSPGATITVNDAGTSHQARVVDTGKLGGTGRFLQQIGRIIGKRHVVFEYETLQADGFVLDQDDRSIYINAKTQISPLAVFGHELTHLLKRDNPQAYAALEAVVQREMGEGALEAFEQQYGEGANIEELTSDLVGNRFQEPDFWQAVFDEVAAQNAEGARGIITRLAAALNRAVNAFLRVVRQQSFKDSDQLVKDLDAIKSAVRQALVTYAQDRREPAMEMEASLTTDNRVADNVSDANLGGQNARFARRNEGVSSVAEKDRSGTGRDGGGEVPEYGKAREGAVSVVGRHYSTGERTTLNGSFYGRGLRGAERDRLDRSPDPRLRSRIYFYADRGQGISPEAGVGAIAHEVRLNNIYDPSTQIIPPQGDSNRFESAVINAGFDGYMAPFAGQAAVVLLGPRHRAVPVKPIGLVAAAERGATAAPSRLKKGLLSREAREIDVDAIPGARLESGNLEIPAESREAANTELERIGSDVRFSRQRAIDSASLDEMFKLARGQSWARGRDLKVAMQQRVLDATIAAGLDATQDNEETRQYLVDVGLKDARTALSQNENAIGWYDLKTRQALAVMALVHPEIAKNEDARFAFTWALAVTSNGLKVDKNFELAEQVYETYKRTGSMPTDVGIGTAGNAIDKSLTLFNELRDAWGMENLRKFMQTNFTVSEITGISKALKPGGEHADVTVKGAAILGPKIGNGFFSNLYGNFDALTMDRWLIRTWGRWTGTLIKAMPEQTAKARTRLNTALQIILESGQAQRLGDLIQMPLTNETDIDDLSRAVQEASTDPTTRDRMNQTDEGLELRKAGNSLAKYLDGQKEAPSGPTERKYIRAIFNQILSQLKQTNSYKDLTMADLQAVLWYGEKRLYETAKEDTEVDEDTEGYADDEAPDYANAAAQIARQKGVAEKRVKATLKRVEDERSTAARPAAEPGSGVEPVAGAGQQAEARDFARQEKRKFIGERAVLRARADRESDAQQPGAYEKDSGEDGGRVRVLKALGVSYTGVWKIARPTSTVFRANDIAAPEFLELAKTPANAAKFQAAISQNKANLKFGAAVHVYPAEDYQAMRLFLTKDGKSGVAIKPDGDIVSVFSTGGAGRALMELAVAAGGRKLDAFDTILPEFYAPHGFRAVARTRWNDEYAPDNWSKDTFREFNNGEPDVVFMVYDPAKRDAEYSPKDGRVMAGEDGYDRALAAQTRELRKVQRGARIAPAPADSVAVADASAADENIQFSRRRKPDPKETVTAYKLFRVNSRKPGKLFPLFVNANDEVPMGEWLDADVGAGAPPTKTGKPKVKSKLGPLAFRPGWHAGDLPLATHIGGHSVEGLSAPDIRKPTEVWAEVEMAADRDWQTEANKRGINKDGKFIAGEAHITDQIPEDGYYRYKTNSNMTGNWLIGGSMKVNRLLTDAEVEQINSAAGVADLPRQEPFDAKKYGFDAILSRQRGINVRNDGNNRYADLIVDGEKTMESRNTDSLHPYVGRTVGIVRTGEGPAKLIGSVKIGEPIEVDEQEFRELEPEHLVPKGSAFDIKPGSTKFLYPLTEAQRFDEERDVNSRGIVAREVEFSPRRNIFGQQVLANWTSTPDTKMDQLLYTMQDKQIDTKRVVESIKAAAGNIADKWNPYLQEELYHGRTAKQTKDFLTDELRPLLLDMQARSVSIQDFEEYLHNRHAEERNKQIAKVNPTMQDGGSGIDTADARAYLAGLDPAKRRAFDALAQRVDAITAGTRQLLVDSGLETQDTISKWEGAYSKYVPLYREDLDFSSSSSGMGTGQGYQVKGAASRRATGSSRTVVDILANLAMQRERAIVRSQKADVARAVYGLAVQNPNTDFWLAVDPAGQKDPNKAMADLMAMGLSPLDAENIIEEPTQSMIDPRTGLVTQRVNPLLRNSDNVLAVRIDGEEKYVFFNVNDERSQRMVSAIKNLDADQLGRVMGITAQITRYFASVNTQYNPIFGAVNFMRDVQGAVVNLSTTPIADKKAQVLADSMLALRGIYSDLRSQRAGRGPATGTWATLFEEFQKEGGQTGFRDMFSRSEERGKALEAELNKITEGKAKQFGRAIFDWLSDYNETMENAVRLAAYKAAKDKGLSNQQAASVAKNLTVNFNRKGQVATQAGALYAFFNASVQGTARLAETLRGPAGKKILAGGLLLGTAQAMLLAAAGFGDDEPPDFVKERNLVIPVGDGKYLTVPMPLGLNVIPNTSRVLTEFALSGFKEPAKRIGQITGAFLEMFNPIGNAGWSVQTIAPTIADPLVALAENRDYTGKPIAKQDMTSTDPTPGYTRAKETASWFSKQLAYFLNLASGGTKYKPGLISPTPDQIDYLIGQATGGVGRELLKVEQTATSRVTGEELPPYKVPVLGRFYGDTKSAAAESNRFYENITRLNEHENEIKGRKKNRENPGEYIRENPEARLVNLGNKIERDVQDLRKRKRDMLERDASPESIKMIELQITRKMKLLNDRVRSLREKEAA